MAVFEADVIEIFGAGVAAYDVGAAAVFCRITLWRSKVWRGRHEVGSSHSGEEVVVE